MINIWTIVIVIISSLIKGLTGFGFALISLPLLLFWYSPKEIIPVLMICNFIASLLIVVQKKEQKLIHKQTYILIGSGGLFTLAGVLVLKSANENLLVHISGVFFIALAILGLKDTNRNRTALPNIAYPLAGALIGFLTGVISVSGPPLALFLNRAKVSNREFREVFAWFSVVTAAIAIVGYYHTGMLTPNAIKTALIFTPILLLGTIVGKYFNSLISITRFQKLNLVLTILSCILLLIS